MSTNPASLRALGDYLGDHGAVNLGVVGNLSHCAGYHLGRDRIFGTCACRPEGECVPGRRENDYSVRQARDLQGLSDAASAIDIGKVQGTLKGLQELSVWLVGECLNRAIDTLDIREVIYSPDGTKVERWDALTNTVYPGGTGTGQGDDSHRTHTHISYFRDSEARDKTGPFRRYWEDEVITVIKGEDWSVDVRRPYRSRPDRTNDAIVGYLEAGTTVRTIAEVTAGNNNWRLTEIDGKPAYLLRSDLLPLVPGGDPTVDQGLSDYIARKPAPDCGAAEKAAADAVAGAAATKAAEYGG